MANPTPAAIIAAVKAQRTISTIVPVATPLAAKLAADRGVVVQAIQGDTASASVSTA